MNVSTEVGSARLDVAKLAAAAFLLIAGIVAYYLLSDYSVLLRALGLMVIVGGAAAIGMQTAPGRQLWQFVSDSRMEVRKVVWPSRQETIQTTLIVMAMVFIVGFVMWLFDMILMGILRFLTGQGG